MPNLQTLFINRNTFSSTSFTNNKSRSSRLENVLRGKGAPEEKKNISSTLASSILRIQSDLVTEQSKMQKKICLPKPKTILNVATEHRQP